MVGPPFVFENWVEEMQALNGHGWSKEYRELPMEQVFR